MSKQNSTMTPQNSTFTVRSEVREGKAGKVGRPATGRNARIIRLSIPIWLADQAKQAASDEGETYSGFISRAMEAALVQFQSNQ